MTESKGQRRVLIVDDKAVIRNILRMYLTQEGFEVLEAGSGIEAVETLAREKVDLVLMDVMMPQMDGLAALQQILTDARISPKPKVIMVTAKGGRFDIVEAIKKGANDYVVKPFTKTVVLEKVRKHAPSSGAPPRSAAAPEGTEPAEGPPKTSPAEPPDAEKPAKLPRKPTKAPGAPPPRPPSEL